MLEKEGIKLHDSQKVDPRQSPDNLPLSFAQARLWFFDQLEPGKSIYNICRAQCLTGPIDLAALTESLNEIVRRHEILRTTFPSVDGQPVQVISPTLILTIPIIDLQQLPRPARESAASRIATEAARYAFNLTLGPLLRLTLLRLAMEDHILLLTVHQIIHDGWSVGVFFRELETMYRSFSEGDPALLPELPVQYADFAVWQRKWLEGEVLQSQPCYWRNQLGDTLPCWNSQPTIQDQRLRRSGEHGKP